MNTIEKNRLIAEFMGNLTRENNVFWSELPLWFSETTPIEKAKYHSSWDWLMPVVMKIESMGYVVNISGISCSVNEILKNKSFIQLVLGEKSRKIELVYSVVCEFIEWYNNNN